MDPFDEAWYQKMRDMAIKMMRSIGNFAGGCNVQFAVSPDEHEDIVPLAGALKHMRYGIISTS